MQAHKKLAFLLVLLTLWGCRGLSKGGSTLAVPGHQKPAVQDENPYPASAAAGSEDAGEPVGEMTINGETISVADVLKPLRETLEENARVLPANQYAEFLMPRIQRRIRLLARDMLLFQESVKSLTDREQEALEKLIDKRLRQRVNNEFGGRQSRLEQALVRDNMTLEDERERIRRELVIARWLQRNIAHRIVDPTRDELWTVFENQKAALTQPPRRQMLLIEIPVLAELPAGVTAPDDAQLQQARNAARTKARAARDAILGGQEFASVVWIHSAGLHARNGGRWGWVTRGSVRKRWEAAVDALFELPEIGVPSRVIETPDAFFIVQADKIDPGVQPNFESLQPDLIERFRDAQFNELVDRQVVKLQADAHIRPVNLNRFLQAVLAAAPQPTAPPR